MPLARSTEGQNRRKGPLLVTCGVAVASLAAVSGYVTGWTKLLEKFGKLQDAVTKIPGLQNMPAWGTAAVLVACLAVISLSVFLPKWLERRRAATLKKGLDEAKQLLAIAEKKRLFRLTPIPAPSTDDEPIDFKRADGYHEGILKWIRRSKLPLLYVTGFSGSGKSSLMQAYVVPMLRRGCEGSTIGTEPNTAAVIMRAFGDINQTVRETIGAKGLLWKVPPDMTGWDARLVLEKASERLSDHHRRLVIVFDQFEEVLVDVEMGELRNLQAVTLVRTLYELPIPGVCCVLILRAEYGDELVSLGLPAREEGKTWQDVPAFSIPDAAKFLADGLPREGLSKAESDSRAVTMAREAETLVDLPGRVTPIALNMIGQMYVEDPILGALLAKPSINAVEGILPAYVRRRVESGDLREAGPTVLECLVTREGRRIKPTTASVLAKQTAITEGSLETALLILARHGLVRLVGERWEVAHDFLAPLIRRALDRISASLLRRLRPWIPVGLAAMFAVMLAGLWGWGQHRLNVEQAQVIEDANEFTQQAIPDYFNHSIVFTKVPTTGACRHLSTLPGSWILSFGSDFGPDNDVNAFEKLRAFRNVKNSNVIRINLDLIKDVDSLAEEIARPDCGLKGLVSLDFAYTYPTDASLRELAKPDSGLKSLVKLNFCPLGVGSTRITDAGLKELARPDSGLTALTSLDLGRTAITDKGMQVIASADTGLRVLSSLILANTKITDAGLKTLARPDTGLKALSSLDLRDTDVTDEGLKALARPDSGLRALTSLNLGDTKITDAGVKTLVQSDTLKTLSSLDLSGEMITEASIQELARPGSGLRSLRKLYTYPWPGIEALKTARPELSVINTWGGN